MKLMWRWCGPELISTTDGRVPWLLVMAALVCIGAFMGVFYKRNFTSLNDRNALDIAQVARNISSGQGFTTRVVRPFNVPFKTLDDSGWPELNRAPLLPYLLSETFRLRGASDQAVVETSLAFGFLAVAATFMLGKLLFDWRAGLLAAAVFGLSAPVLKVMASGQEWSLATFLFTFLLCIVALHHRSVLDEKRKAALVYASLAAAVTALLYMTNYVMVSLALPLAVYFALSGRSRWINTAAFAIVFAVIVSPLICRNAAYTDNPILGAGAWDVMAGTTAYPGDTLYRSVNNPIHSAGAPLLFAVEHFPDLSAKLGRSTSVLVNSALSMLGWIALPFALVCMLYKFKTPTANAVRGIMYAAAPLGVLCFALFSVEPGATAVLAPAAAVFACAYFLLLLNAKKLHPVYARGMVKAFLFIAMAPALIAIAWPDNTPDDPRTVVVHRLFANAGTKGVSGILYTDVPWLSAWRTNSLAGWLPCTDSDVSELAAKGVPMRVIILTPESERYSPQEVW